MDSWGQQELSFFFFSVQYVPFTIEDSSTVEERKKIM